MFKEMEAINNIMIKAKNREKGYEPKCKVCNHKEKDDIERLHDLGYTNRNIMRELDLWEDLTEQALGRHLNKHYPLSKKYYAKQRLLNEKALQEAFKYNTQLKNFILDNDDETAMNFLNKKGFCHTSDNLCSLIEPSQSKSGDEVLTDLNIEYYNLKYDYSHSKDSKIIKITDKLNKCYTCQLSNMQFNYNTLFEILVKEVFKIDVDYEKDLINIIQDNDYDKDIIINKLYKYRQEENENEKSNNLIDL
jgi:hypothetical protein